MNPRQAADVNLIAMGIPFRFLLHDDLQSTLKFSPEEEDQWWKEHQYNVVYSLYNDIDGRLYFNVELQDRSGVRKSGWYIHKTSGNLYVPCNKTHEVYTPNEYYVDFFFDPYPKLLIREPENVVLFKKVGAFYDLYDEDAKLFRFLWDYPLMQKRYARTVIEESKLAKYTSLLEAKDIPYRIIY